MFGGIVLDPIAKHTRAYSFLEEPEKDCDSYLLLEMNSSQCFCVKYLTRPMNFTDAKTSSYLYIGLSFETENTIFNKSYPDSSSFPLPPLPFQF